MSFNSCLKHLLLSGVNAISIFEEADFVELLVVVDFVGEDFLELLDEEASDSEEDFVELLVDVVLVAVDFLEEPLENISTSLLTGVGTSMLIPDFNVDFGLLGITIVKFVAFFIYTLHIQKNYFLIVIPLKYFIVWFE